MRWIYRLLGVIGDIKSAVRGPGPFAKRQIRKSAHRNLAKLLRKI
jgi:hypothetical protein